MIETSLQLLLNLSETFIILGFVLVLFKIKITQENNFILWIIISLLSFIVQNHFNANIVFGILVYFFTILIFYRNISKIKLFLVILLGFVFDLSIQMAICMPILALFGFNIQTFKSSILLSYLLIVPIRTIEIILLFIIHRRNEKYENWKNVNSIR